MDIFDSDIGYLGYDSSEGYGLTWKVIGRQAGLLDLVNVLGDIQNSHIHHNYFGVYTFGAYGMQWLNNEVSDNIQYGFDPHDDSDHLLIQGNDVHHNGNHGIIASMRCDHLTIRSNTCWANAQNGIILHRSSDDCLIEQNQCFDNKDTGVVLAGSARCIVRSNLLVRNFEASVRLSVGSADNLVEANECASNTWYGFYLYKGDDVPEPNDDGRPKRNRLVANRVHDNGHEAINLADGDDNTFANNVFSANGDKLIFVRGFRNRLDGNDIPPDVMVRTEGSPADAASTYILNQASARVQVDAYGSTVFQDDNGQIFDPEEKGVLTAVTTIGSTLVLGAAEIGTTSAVVARQLWVSAPEGTVFIDPIDWTNAGPAGKKWTARADPPQQSVRFTVGARPRSASNRPSRWNSSESPPSGNSTLLSRPVVTLI
jgi:parallel beta-helix repeat protein